MKFAYCAVFVGVVSAFMSIPALGNIKLTFDENGNGTWQDSVLPTQNGYTGTSGTLAFSYAPDPTGNISGSVLIYKLPALVTSGPTDIGELGATVGIRDSNPSDILFFTNSSGASDHLLDANLMIFYSQGVGGGSLADTGLPAIAGTLADAASEDANGNVQWLPNIAIFPTGSEYDGVSGTVPEPATLALLGLTVPLLCMRHRRF
ncbi:MAG TPA: PEP-CTERM sorting domain-containing protein [Tepidisphaeraceae bacterium]|jgi:hypothetical protein